MRPEIRQCEWLPVYLPNVFEQEPAVHTILVLVYPRRLAVAFSKMPITLHLMKSPVLLLWHLDWL